MKKGLRYIYNFLFTNKTRWLTVRVIFLSLYYRLKLLVFTQNINEKSFGIKGESTGKEETRKNMVAAYWIGERVERVCDKMPWESKCLVKALIAQRFLVERNIQSTLYLGVENKDNIMTAHAWLRCGTVYVTGGNGGTNTVVAYFSK